MTNSKDKNKLKLMRKMLKSRNGATMDDFIGLGMDRRNVHRYLTAIADANQDFELTRSFKRPTTYRLVRR